MTNIVISIGKSRHDKRWKQKTTTWEKIVAKLRNTHRTTETMAEYNAASRDRKAEIKDVGGFVGGIVENGLRKKENVNQRTLVTLDIDYATSADIWDDITLLYNCAMLMYSTHSHTPENPRFRLVMPLNRPVDRDEYEAISRKIAASIGIDQFDDSTYQPERLMFWASTSKDGEYIFKESKGEFLNADEILATYHNWRDVTQWEISSRQIGLVHKAMKKAGNPLEKPGLIGLFCRTYTIQEVIEEYLSEDYIQFANDENRYTYVKGSTSGGLVIYDDIFAYSHHGTDPTGGMLCNAFDLVRIHKFNELDEDMKPDVEITKTPSYRAMEQLVAKDKTVKKSMAEEAKSRVQDDFAHISGQIESDDEEDNEWMQDLDMTKEGSFKSTSHNILAILNNAKGLKHNLCRDLLARAEVVKGDLPWRKIHPQDIAARFWNNSDDAQLQVYFDVVYGISGKDKILNARIKVMDDNAFHPVKDYLKSISWDGIERLDTLFIDYLGAEDTPLNRAITRKSIVAAVARIMAPACKYDYITVLQGPEGIGKSTILSKLGGRWFNDTITDLQGKQGIEQISGSWICELGELEGIKHNEVEAVKAFVSRQVDFYRPAYGRVKETVPRQCVFFATTNEAEFLKGNNGNRRFWVLTCDSKAAKDVWDFNETDRSQIWAEAYQKYKDGEDLFLEKDMEQLMRIRQQTYNEINNDARTGLIEEYLKKPLPTEWKTMAPDQRLIYLADDDRIEADGTQKRKRVCAIEILCEVFREKMDDRTRYKVQDINKILDTIPGWKKCPTPRKFDYYGNQRGYERIEED